MHCWQGVSSLDQRGPERHSGLFFKRAAEIRLADSFVKKSQVPIPLPDRAFAAGESDEVSSLLADFQAALTRPPFAALRGTGYE